MILVAQNATIRKKESGGVRFQYWGNELELGFEGSRLHCLWARGGPPSGMSQAEGSHVDLCLADGVTRFASRGCFRAAEGRPGPERTDRAVPTISASHAEQTDRQTDRRSCFPSLPLRVSGNGTGDSHAPARNLYQAPILAAARPQQATGRGLEILV